MVGWLYMAHNSHNQPHNKSLESTTSRHNAARRANVAANQDGHTNPNLEFVADASIKSGAESKALYTLSIPQVRKMLVEAGHIVSERTLLRWCAKELLDATLRPEGNGQYEKYYVNKDSVIRKISQLARVRPTTTPIESVAPSKDINKSELASTNFDHRDARRGSSKNSPKHLDPDSEIQNLRDKIQILDVDIQVKEKLLIREKEATREAWNKIAEVGEQAGEWKAKYEQLKLAAPIPPQNDSDTSNYREVEFTATSDPAQTKADIPKKGEPNSTVSNEARDNRKAVNPSSGGVNRLNHALIYAILAALTVLTVLLLVIVGT